ncbi:MAG: HAD hydrolase-like protein [Patescibacteria group bacterium]
MMKLAVFDWNGTLLADTLAVLDGVNHELAFINHPPITMRQYREFYDTPLIKFMEKIGVDKELFEAKGMGMARAFHAYYEPRASKLRTRAGVRQTLDTLLEADVRCIILSNHTLEGVYLQLERLKLSKYFSEVLANEAQGMNHYQGKQERLQQYMADTNFKASQAVIIGDTDEEVRIGRNLGLKTVSITGGHNSTRRLKQAKPDVLVSRVPDIVGNIKEL